MTNVNCRFAPVTGSCFHISRRKAKLRTPPKDRDREVIDLTSETESVSDAVTFEVKLQHCNMLLVSRQDESVL